jgi:protoheme IX farnesyltransferase
MASSRFSAGVPMLLVERRALRGAAMAANPSRRPAAVVQPTAYRAHRRRERRRPLGRQRSTAGRRLVPRGPMAQTRSFRPVAPAGSALAMWLLRLRHLRGVLNDYVALTKPGILSLLLVTTLGAMLIAAEGVPPFALVLWTLLGGVLAAGGANVLNCYIDRDIDAIMPRTRHRATAAGRISPRAALAFGLGLTALAAVELALLVNPLAAGLALIGNAYYVLVYTKWLKRTTSQNIVIGGAAGAVPPLVGWAAATGSLAPSAWVLFAIVFLWTPPHFWALALLKQGEYGRVAVPMLPVVAGEAATRRQIVAYAAVLAAVSLLLVPLGLSWIYLVGALATNAVFLGIALRLWWAPSKRLARQLFFFSLWYLALVFAAGVADRLLLA